VREEAATLLAAALWGSSFVAIKYGLALTDPFLFLFLRFVVALAMVLLAYPLLRRRPDYSLLKERVVLLLALTNTLGYLFEYVGLTIISATESALLVNTGVIFVAAMSFYFLHEIFSVRKGAAVALGILGVSFLTTRGDMSNLHLGTILGDAVSLLSAFMWALMMILNKKAVERYRLLDLLFALEVWTLLMLSPLLLFSPMIITGRVLLISSAMGIFYSVVPYLLWSYGLKKISATSSSIILLTEVFFAALLSFFLLGERLSSIEFFGGLLILFAIFLSSKETS